MKGFAVSMLLLYLTLGALAAYFGFTAMNQSNYTEYHVLLVNDVCIYPDSPAQTSGLLAGLILLLAQMLVVCTSGCSCRWNNKKQPEGWNATMVGVGCILGCVAAGLGAAFFASGSALSRPSERYRTRHKTNDSDDCVQPDFIAAIALLFCTLVFGFVFFLAIIREVRNGALTSPLPQIPPPMATPRQPPNSPAPHPPPSSSSVHPVSDQSPV